MAHWLRQDYGFSTADWYSPYEALNEMKLPVESFMEIQKAAIGESLDGGGKKVMIDKLNNFLFQLQNNYTELGEEGDLFSNLISKINSGYAAFDNQQKPKPNPPEFLQNYENMIREYVDLIAQFTGSEVPESIIEQIQGMQNRITQNANFHAFKKRKAAFLEDVASWVMSLAGFQTATTGNFIDKFGKQLIADSVAFLQDSFKSNSTTKSDGFLKAELRMTGVDTKSGNAELYEYLKEAFPQQADSLQYGKNNWIEFEIDPSISGFKNLLEDVQSSINHNVTVKLNDTFLSDVEKGLRVQVKSGGKQDLFNKQKRNLISQREMFAWNSYLEIAKHFYDTFNYDDKVENGTSENLNAYINYTFSQHIMDTVLGKNEFYLSSHGFSTLDQQMEEGNIHFELAPTIDSLKLLSTIDEYNIIQVNG